MKEENKVEITKGVEISIKPSLEHTPVRDHVVNVVKASLSAIPIIGGPISSLIGDYIPKKKESPLFNFIKEFQGDNFNDEDIHGFDHFRKLRNNSVYKSAKVMGENDKSSILFSKKLIHKVQSLLNEK